ncbi:MAG TPA: DUF177 domain-containing protein [Acidimicrobiales bacterium]|nr:DUF177 domain-containing protein [Acidimicrobiales bacterium]
MTRTDFRVGIASLARQGSRREHRRGQIAGLAVSGSRVRPGSEIDVNVLLEPVTHGVMVSGRVDAQWEGECRRCLGQATGALHAEVRELYEEHSSGDETYPLAGDELDLEPLARDAVLLELPQAPLCREECRGLCPTCGADLNEVRCECPPAGGDPRWAALDSLRQTDSHGS